MTAVANIQASGNTQSVVAAVKTAAASTGTDFDYLLQTAVRESSLKPSAKASTSSAAGLFQFIEQTWFGVMKRHGAEFGLGKEAAAIDTTSGGRHKVTDRQEREAILALRHDPRVSALMAGALTRESQQTLEAGIGREATSGELYIAHFLGSGGAVKLVNAAEDDPSARASALFPAAANANKSIFYDKTGRAKSVSEVYDRLTRETDIGAKAEAAVAALGDAPQRGSHFAGLYSSHRPSSLIRQTQITSYEGSRYDAGSSLASLMPSSGIPATSASMMLTPAVLDVLSSLDPLPAINGGNSEDSRRDADNDDDYTFSPRAVARNYVDTLRGAFA